MRPMALFLLLGAWAVVLAQTPPGEDPGVAPEAEDTVAPCVPAGEAGSPDGEPADEEPSAEPCVEPSPETFQEEEPYLGETPAGGEGEVDALEEEFGGAIEENNLPTEASVEEEFKPGDEISEDYPVPLPSDI